MSFNTSGDSGVAASARSDVRQRPSAQPVGDSGIGKLKKLSSIFELFLQVCQILVSNESPYFSHYRQEIQNMFL